MDIEIKQAQNSDLDSIIEMLADDDLGSKREQVTQPLPKPYQTAFDAINKNSNAKLIVAKQKERVIGVAQIDFITYLTYQGGTRAQIEGVRVHKDYRSQGVGKLLFEYLIKLAKERGCHMVQLTTNKDRPDAFRFYENFGFVNSHNGFKFLLE